MAKKYLRAIIFIAQSIISYKGKIEDSVVIVEGAVWLQGSGRK